MSGLLESMSNYQFHPNMKARDGGRREGARPEGLLPRRLRYDYEVNLECARKDRQTDRSRRVRELSVSRSALRTAEMACIVNIPTAPEGATRGHLILLAIQDGIERY